MKNNMEIFNLIERSGHLFPYFDYAHGYGIPQASYFFKSQTVSEKENPIVVLQDSDEVSIKVTDLSKSDEKYKDYLYYHIQNDLGVLEYYAVLDVKENDVVTVPIEKLGKDRTLRVYYKGFIQEMKF